MLWKRLNTETSQRGNTSKTGFQEFPFFWEISQNGKILRDFRIFLRRFLIFKVEVFPLSILRRFRFFEKSFKTLFCWGVSSFFWGVSVFLKKLLKLLFCWDVSSFLRRFRFFEAFLFFQKTFKTLICWGISYSFVC